MRRFEHSICERALLMSNLCIRYDGAVGVDGVSFPAKLDGGLVGCGEKNVQGVFCVVFFPLMIPSNFIPLFSHTRKPIKLPKPRRLN